MVCCYLLNSFSLIKPQPSETKAALMTAQLTTTMAPKVMPLASPGPMSICLPVGVFKFDLFSANKVCAFFVNDYFFIHFGRKRKLSGE